MYMYTSIYKFFDTSITKTCDKCLRILTSFLIFIFFIAPANHNFILIFLTTCIQFMKRNVKRVCRTLKLCLYNKIISLK